MPKRVADKDNYDYFENKLKKLEREIQKTRKPRIRIIESSSSSASSREPSSAPQDSRDGDIRGSLSMGDNDDDQVTIASLLKERPATSTATDDALDSIMLEILGEDPSATITYGPDVHKNISGRFEHIATNGLDANLRKELIAKYPVPGNCSLIAAPVLNAEIKAALPDSILKRDKSVEIRQKQLSTAISCLASVMTEQLSSTQIHQDLVKKLMDTTRLLCDIQYTDSKTRRNFTMYSVKKDMKEHLSNTKIDKFLFGENLLDTVKAAKAVSKSCMDLKVQDKPFRKPGPAQNTKPQTAKNWKSPAPARRPPAQPRTREHVSRRAQPDNASRMLSHPPRTTRRR